MKEKLKNLDVYINDEGKVGIHLDKWEWTGPFDSRTQAKSLVIGFMNNSDRVTYCGREEGRVLGNLEDILKTLEKEYNER
jgi:hypothetical protein